MKGDLAERLAGAMDLTCRGDLTAATAAIQQALSNPSAIQSPTDVAAGYPSANVVQEVTRSRFVQGENTVEYRLFSPQGLIRAAPLLVMLHGCTQDAEDFALGTDMDALASETGLHVLYPSQSAMRNVRRCWNWFEPAHQRRGAGEAAALHALTRQLARMPMIDDTRVFVAGMSAGGAMALVLADQYPESFSAVGVHSGIPVGAARTTAQALAAMRGERCPEAPCRPSGRVPPLIVFHGDADTLVHPCNAAHMVAARLHHEQSLSQARSGLCNGRNFTCTVHRDGQGAVVCEHWDVQGTAHQWSGGNPAGTHTVGHGPVASAEMLRFFAQCEPLC